MTRRQTKPSNLYPNGTNTSQGDQLRPISRARPSHLLPVLGMEEAHIPHPHEAAPPSTLGFNRPKMDRPRVRPSNSGNSIVGEVQQIKDTQRGHARPLNHGQYQHQTTGDAAVCFPHIGKTGHRAQKLLQKIDETAGYAAFENTNIQLPSLTGKFPAPPETAKPGIPRSKAFAHNHIQENTPHHPPGRRFKTMVHADHHIVVTGLPPAPPQRPTDYAPAACNGSKKTAAAAVEAKMSDHMMSATKEKIHLSPSDLRVISPGSQGSRSHTTINHEIIKSPSSLMDVTMKESGHSLHEKRKSSLIDVHIQPTKMAPAAKDTADKHNKRRGGRC